MGLANMLAWILTAAEGFEEDSVALCLENLHNGSSMGRDGWMLSKGLSPVLPRI